MAGLILDALTASQREAVLHKEGPLLVLAGPGSGKTRVITYRIAVLIRSGVRPWSVCAITFTNKAAEEMRQRAQSLDVPRGPQISTFHSLCVRLLRQYGRAVGVQPGFSIYDTADQSKCMKQALKDCEIDSTQFSPARLLDAVSTLKNKLVGAEAFSASAQDFFSKALSRAYARYQALLASQNALDFDDLLAKTAILLEGQAEVCREVQDRLQFLLIDEYQDTNHAQYRIAKALASAHGNICATGDPDQSIYRWRGADIRNILAFERDWPHAHVVKLEENFRSAANILKAADQLIQRNRHRKAKRLVPTKPDGDPIDVALCEDEVHEALGIARRIQDLARSCGGLNNVAVFYRVNAMSRTLEEAFIRLRVPYQVVRGVEFYNRKEIRDLLAYLKVVVNPLDEVALRRILNTPARGIGDVTVSKVQAFASARGIGLSAALAQAGSIDALSDALRTRLKAFAARLESFRKDLKGPASPVVERVFVESGLEEALRNAGQEGREALENCQELISAAGHYDQQAEDPSLVDWLQQISLFSDTDTYDGGANRVALMSLHAAKGLEFDHVFIAGLEEGLLPHEQSSEDEEEIEEERRLFFVGLTRARKTVHLSHCRYRMIRGQTLRAVASPFLYELGTGYGAPAAEDGHAHVHDREPRYEPVDPDVAAPFARGDLVRHKTFGLGRVQGFADMGENSLVTVHFNTGQTKTLMLRYAQLVKA
ncbi:MAG: UvrD-helicase domain-containing protein [Phycisphaerae bacterium]|nr:UvrD-helicase domain-containing protein [Phycisphaerae bacterium]